MKYYKGKEVCQGCGKPGTEEIRWSKDELCEPCKETLRKGKLSHKLEELEINRVFDWFHGMTDLKGDPFDRVNTLDKFVTEVFKAISLADKSTDAPRSLPVTDVRFKRAQSHGVQFYYIPKSLYEPFNKLALQLEDAVKELNRRFEEADNYAKLAVQKERDRIYNEGIQKGRDLLFGLNSGEISMSEFEKQFTYTN